MILPIEIQQYSGGGGTSGCANNKENKLCPISRTSCPGECIYSYVLENIGVGILVLDANEKIIIFQNSSASEVLGQTVTSKDYHSVRSLFALPEELPAAEKFGIPKTLSYGDKLFGYTLYHIKGGYLWLFIRDITEKKQEEEKLLRLVAAVESTAEAISITDTDGLIQYVNTAFQRITGYTREEVVGRPRILADDRHDISFYESVRQAVKQQDRWSGHIINRRKDGSPYEADVVISPIRGISGEIASYVQVERDVTEKMRLESMAEAINSMNNIGYVFSGVRHEIGNPINSIKTTLSVLAHNLEAYSKETVKEYINRSMIEIGRVEYLLRTMKSFNMYESPELKDVELPVFMEKFLPIVHGDFEKRGIELVSIAHPEVRWARVDPRALHQVLLNILTNASDACDSRDDPKIVISMFRSGARICISVMDNGLGISEERKERLFVPFYTTKLNGTGLGLTIVKKMLAKMEGTVSITSQEGGGTIVDVWIPEGQRGQP